MLIFPTYKVSRAHITRRALNTAAAAICLVALQSCFTGIESTKRIEPTKADLRELAPSKEEILMSRVTPTPLALWEKGKRFSVADQRIEYILQPVSGTRSILKGGDILTFAGVSEIVMPDASRNCAIVLEDCDGGRFLLNTSRPADSAGEMVLSDRLPMLRDMKMISQTDSLLRGRKLWSLSPLVYDENSTRLETLKFLPLTVDSVTPGDARFPMRVWTTDSLSRPRFYFMGFNDSSSESRPMEKVFSLSDPRLLYPRISEAHWQAIRRRGLIPGMTKEECRLSLGSPSDATAGRDYSSTIDLWQYPDGTYLRFIDGLLVDFRK